MHRRALSDLCGSDRSWRAIDHGAPFDDDSSSGGGGALDFALHDRPDSTGRFSKPQRTALQCLLVECSVSSACRAAEQRMSSGRAVHAESAVEYYSTTCSGTAASPVLPHAVSGTARCAHAVRSPLGQIGSTNVGSYGAGQHSTAQHSTAQHSTAHHSTAQHSVPQGMALGCTAGQALRARGTAMRRKGPRQLAE